MVSAQDPPGVQVREAEIYGGAERSAEYWVDPQRRFKRDKRNRTRIRSLQLLGNAHLRLVILRVVSQHCGNRTQHHGGNECTTGSRCRTGGAATPNTSGRRRPEKASVNVGRGNAARVRALSTPGRERLVTHDGYHH